MFIGSINRYMRAVVEQASAAWKGLPVYVAFSRQSAVECMPARMTTCERALGQP